MFQTVFYLKDYLTCKKGEEVRGSFSMRPNERNVRDMDFEISVDFKVVKCLITLKCRACRGEIGGAISVSPTLDSRRWIFLIVSPVFQFTPLKVP